MCKKASSFSPASLEVEAIAEAPRSWIRNECLANDGMCALGWEDQPEISSTSTCQKHFSSSFTVGWGCHCHLKQRLFFQSALTKILYWISLEGRPYSTIFKIKPVSILGLQGKKACSFKSDFFLSQVSCRYRLVLNYLVLPPLPKCWDYMCRLHIWLYAMLGIIPKASCMLGKHSTN